MNDAGNPERSDVDLMRAAREGDSDAYSTLVRRHQDALVNFFARLGVYHEREDLAQETFVRIYKARRRYRARAGFRSYLYTVARRVWIDFVRRSDRRQNRLAALREEAEIESQGNNPIPGRRLDVQAAVAALPEKLKLVVVMSVYQGLKYEEISRALNVPVGTVKSRMHLAMQRLRAGLIEGQQDDLP